MFEKKNFATNYLFVRPRIFRITFIYNNIKNIYIYNIKYKMEY